MCCCLSTKQQLSALVVSVATTDITQNKIQSTIVVWSSICCYCLSSVYWVSRPSFVAVCSQSVVVTRLFSLSLIQKLTTVRLWRAYLKQDPEALKVWCVCLISSIRVSLLLSSNWMCCCSQQILLSFLPCFVLYLWNFARLVLDWWAGWWNGPCVYCLCNITKWRKGQNISRHERHTRTTRWWEQTTINNNSSNKHWWEQTTVKQMNSLNQNLNFVTLSLLFTGRIQNWWGGS